MVEAETRNENLQLVTKTIGLINELDVTRTKQEILLIAIGTRLFPQGIKSYAERMGLTEDQIGMCSRAVEVNPGLRANFQHIMKMISGEEKPQPHSKAANAAQDSDDSGNHEHQDKEQVYQPGNQETIRVRYETVFDTEKTLSTRKKILALLEEHHLRYSQIPVNYQTVANHIGKTRQAINHIVKEDEIFKEELAATGLTLEKVGRSTRIRPIEKQA